MNIETLRARFEVWVMSVEHKPYGWLGREWLDRQDDSYEDSYVHGLWTAYQMCKSKPHDTINEAVQWIDCKERMPERGVEVLVRYTRPWPYDFKSTVNGAVLDKPWADEEHMFWYNGRGEGMSGVVTHWMPMIDVGLPDA